MGTKDSLRKIIADFQQIIKDKGYFFENELTALDEKLDEDVFRLAVVGEYSTGKSTFINALIGQDLLLHMKREATATITYIHNVPKNSDKIGRCEIYYHTGEKKELDNLHDLAKYTTTKSDVDVVREIAHVDVYVNFMGTDVPIIITDTPGLNGMAEGHKEITIGEIKKAHACIYLFSIKGITAYDVTFAKVMYDSLKNKISSQKGESHLRPSGSELINMYEDLKGEAFFEQWCDNMQDNPIEIDESLVEKYFGEYYLKTEKR